MTRAFTLLEILLATAMLALIAVASTSLVQTVSRARAAREAPLRWQSAAERTLDLIASDLRRADIGIVPEAVVARDQELRLACRAVLTDGSAPAEIVYCLDADGKLRRELHPLGRQLGARGAPVSSSVVLGDVAIFAPERDEDRSSLVLRLERMVNIAGLSARGIAPGATHQLQRTVRVP